MLGAPIIVDAGLACGASAKPTATVRYAHTEARTPAA
jgi:hypothetical protein